ncbi:MAG: hypothetical protein ACR2KG_11565, partial [Nocardioidaceae bacterium]
ATDRPRRCPHPRHPTRSLTTIRTFHVRQASNFPGHLDVRQDGPSHRNTRSLRVLEKCGFTQGLWIDGLSDPGERPDTEIVCTFDVRHWLGR